MNSGFENANQRLSAVRSRINDACKKYHRNENSVTLVAVGKTHADTRVRELFEAGQRVFAENYVQEGVAKTRALSDLDIEWHFIGHIQSNKCAEIAGHFDWIHSVDRYKIARRLAENASTGSPLNIMIQVNIDNEPSKSGILPDQLSELVDQILGLKHIQLRGLMAIPRAETDFDLQRTAFARLRKLRDTLSAKHPGIDCLSMGMSGDIEAAIAEGATHIRVGTALFGPRDYSKA